MNQAIKLFAIALPDGKWWRRGHGVPSRAHRGVRMATLYTTLGGAKRAAAYAGLEQYRIHEVALVNKGVVFEGNVPWSKHRAHERR